MEQENYDVCVKPEFVGELENKEKTELGMNSWHGTKYTQPKQLCNAVLHGEQCTRQKCDRFHDLNEYLAQKPKSLDLACPLYTSYGSCEYKYNCVFSHPGDTYVNPDFQSSRPEYQNQLGYKLIKEFDFNAPFNPTRTHEGFSFRNKLMLAPMCTVGTMPFRRWCKRFGCDVTCSEMIFARDLLNCQSYEIAKLRRHVEEDQFGIQLTGNAYELEKCCKVLGEFCNYDYIELNAACPQDLATQRKCGFQIAQENKIKGCLDKMFSVTNKNSSMLSLKTRIADFCGESRADKLIHKELFDGIGNITLHGRSAKQRYQKSADYDSMEKFAIDLKQEHKEINFTVNGDLFDVDQFVKVKQQGWADSFMIGRGALTKPWIFQEFKTQTKMDPSSSQRITWLKEFAGFCIDYSGSDRIGVEKAREQFLENYVYLSRYTPVGILDKPQLLNQRNVNFKGRDEMETLLGSQNIEDWVKVSELFFGSVPEGFQYQSKHKSKGSMQK